METFLFASCLAWMWRWFCYAFGTLPPGVLLSAGGFVLKYINDTSLQTKKGFPNIFESCVWFLSEAFDLHRGGEPLLSSQSRECVKEVLVWPVHVGVVGIWECDRLCSCSRQVYVGSRAMPPSRHTA